MFDQCLYFNTTALARVLEREWTKAFKPFGLTPSQAFMLRAILDKPGLLQSELATGLAISRPTATRSLDGLQKLALIERWSTDRDGRESAIHATALGESMKDGLNAASAEVTKRLKKKLGGAHFEDSVSKMKNIRSLLD
jgi:DNA-binding MarR family transcriptional regulator